MTTALLPQHVNIPGLSESDQGALTTLLMQIAAKSRRNTLRRTYYDGKNALRDLGIAIPPQLRNVETVVGWPAKAVDVLARRVTLDGFTVAGGSAADLGVDRLIEDNRLDVEASQAHTSALVHATAFLAVTAGDVAAGEPVALVTARSAQYATGVWDSRRRGLSSALSIVSVSDDGMPTEMVMYLPGRAIIMRRSGQTWDIRQSTHDMGVPVEPLVFRPELDRPFGHSRITRGVMSLTDSAVRTLLRTEVGAEFYNAPQRYALGADGDAFIDPSTGQPIPAWQAILGRMLAIGKDEDGDTPTVGQFPQQTMQPNVDQLRSLAAMFAAETDLMPDTMGIIQDNPSSAEAIDARKEELRLTAESCIATFGAAWQRTATNALRLYDDSPAARAEYARLRARYRNPATPSMASSADATVKLVGAGVLPPTSEVTYDGLNLSEDQRETLRREMRQARSQAMLSALSVVGAEPVVSGGVAG